ncbi:BlaI/MecI/CopY family transcriptional regulator [Parabacteroides sp. PF5-9]|uniref:BlaI/MecI/CopY family transcriptional regulator n=1 Tax=Parabacteroides sp. PF5-9 TaxID=1742404 RepID=UPI00247609FE|nr:BlaI/MecI/CopY family transcriptional regulator [Parabacteroides sp. PF5-9]MDH6356852.1 BlaI family penicillinase repressor [Parabacteroides sp. PF5-9]
MEKLTIQEEEVMRIIWDVAPCFIKDILAQYDDPKPPYTTIASVVKNLERKKYVKLKRYGNTYEYTPLIEKGEYKRTFMSGVVSNYFADSYKEMVSFFAKDQKISADELKEIIAMIEKGKE